MFLANIDFTDKKFVINFIEQYRKNVTKILDPDVEIILQVNNHTCRLRKVNDLVTMIADAEIKLLENESTGPDIRCKIWNLSAKIFIYGDYLIVIDNGTIYMNGTIVNNSEIANHYKYTDWIYYKYYYDYLILHSYHIATFEHIDNIIKPLRKKICKINIDIKRKLRRVQMYRGVEILLLYGRENLDRFLIRDYRNRFASLQISI